MSLFSTDDYLKALQALIPSGRAWTRDKNAVQTAVLRALARSFQRSDNDAQSLLSGAFPKTATIMLTDWENTLGLPDDCSIGEVDTIAKRQNAIVSKLISTGGQSKAISSVLQPRWATPSPLKNTDRRVLDYLFVETDSMAMTGHSFGW